MRLLILLFLIGFGAVSARAQTRSYTLAVPPSAFDVGCQNRCACPVFSRPTYGSFDLVSTGFDGLYETYRVERYIASFDDGPGAVALTGGGTFRIGGEFALVQQMTLDLASAEGRHFHVDSGVVPVRGVFPKIEVSCAAHGFACYDTVVTVAGAPTGTVDVPPAVTAPAIVGIAPNPFAQATTIRLALDRERPASVTIVDLAGRVVRRLPAGELVTWNGLRDSGEGAQPGVYWLRLRWPGGIDSRRLFKLD